MKQCLKCGTVEPSATHPRNQPGEPANLKGRCHEEATYRELACGELDLRPRTERGGSWLCLGKVLEVPHTLNPSELEHLSRTISRLRT